MFVPVDLQEPALQAVQGVNYILDSYTLLPGMQLGCSNTTALLVC